MTSTDDFFTQYAQHEKLLREANAKNKDSVFAALAEAGIERVDVTFDGEGDSGQIEDVTFYKDDASCTAPRISVAFEDVSWNGTKPLEKQLRDAIESLCYDYLSQEHGGWENDDGAFGEFTFLVETHEIALEFSARYTDSTNYSHTF